VAVVDFGEVVERPRLLGVEHPVVTTVVLDLDEPLLDVDVRGPVLAHGPELDHVAIRSVVAHRKEHIEGAHHVVDLRLHTVTGADHRVGGGALLGEVDDGVGLGGAYQLVDRGGVTEVDLVPVELVAALRLPAGHPVGNRGDRRQAVRPALLVPAAPHQAVDCDDVMAACREVKGGRPSEIAIGPQDRDAHCCLP
jgi:hypothetical protein